jgi:outer membrane protein TolC
MQRAKWRISALVVVGLAVAGASAAEPPADEAAPPPAPLETELPPPRPETDPPGPPPPRCLDPCEVLEGPMFSDHSLAAELDAPEPDLCDRPLPINLATALRLSDARPLIVAAAQATVQLEAARLLQARLLWVPSINTGVSFYQHAGIDQLQIGPSIVNSRQQFVAGTGATAYFATTDAIFAPLAARQVLRASQYDVQAAKNNALLATARAYFDVQQARGQYAGMLDAVAKGRELVRRIDALAKGLAPPIEGDRARTLLAELEQAAASALEQWRVSSATLTRVLRLDPAAVVIPVEPPHLLVTLISPAQPVDDLVMIGLTNRPELAAQQALVQATLQQLRQERMRPLIPSLILYGGSDPDRLMNIGYFASGVAGAGNPSSIRADLSAQAVWELRNLGAGNIARVRERRAQNQLALIELFNVQDTVAAEVAQAHAQLISAAMRYQQAETGLKEALTSYAGNLKGMSETIRFGDVLQLVNRPQEVVASLQQLQQAYLNYFATSADYNRAQFRLFHATGYPARILACERPPGEPEPVDTRRPEYLPPVRAPEPCRCPP